MSAVHSPDNRGPILAAGKEVQSSEEDKVVSFSLIFSCLDYVNYLTTPLTGGTEESTQPMHSAAWEAGLLHSLMPTVEQNLVTFRIRVSVVVDNFGLVKKRKKGGSGRCCDNLRGTLSDTVTWWVGHYPHHTFLLELSNKSQVSPSHRRD